MSNILAALIAILAGFFIWALAELVDCFAEASRLRRGVRALTRGLPAAEAFAPGGSRLQRRAAAVARKAQQDSPVAQFHPERELAAINMELSSRLARPKALSGLLIIFGLLITLINLRNAVEEMRSALQPTPPAVTETPGNQNRSATEPAELRVRQGIQGIATSAGTAFGYSTIAIGLAAIVLMVSVVAQRSASAAAGEFAGWLFEVHDDALLKQTARPQDTAGQLAFAAEALARVAATFEDTNTALADLKQFGGKLENAGREISEAVAALPNHIDNSLTKISADVAEGIRSGLEHQGEYLKALVAIYSEHGLVLQKTIEFMRQIADDHKAASGTIALLRSLPEDIRAVAASATQGMVASRDLGHTVHALEARVGALPGAELSTAARQLGDAATRIINLENDITKMREAADALYRSSADEAARRTSDTIIKHLDKLETAMKAVVTSDVRTYQGAIQRTLNDVRIALDELTRAGQISGRSGIQALHVQLETLTRSVGSLPSARIMRLLGGGKG